MQNYIIDVKYWVYTYFMFFFIQTLVKASNNYIIYYKFHTIFITVLFDVIALFLCNNFKIKLIKIIVL